MEIRLRKFSPYPKENSIGYAVGFSTNFAGSDIYKDTVVDYKDTIDKSKEEIVQIAWDRLKDDILTKVITMDDTYPKLGDAWEPPDLKVDVIAKITELGLDESLIIDSILDNAPILIEEDPPIS